jgi:hypothetical protein
MAILDIREYGRLFEKNNFLGFVTCHLGYFDINAIEKTLADSKI